jgi:hypothetical protein
MKECFLQIDISLPILNDASFNYKTTVVPAKNTGYGFVFPIVGTLLKPELGYVNG